MVGDSDTGCAVGRISRRKSASIRRCRQAGASTCFSRAKRVYREESVSSPACGDALTGPMGSNTREKVFRYKPAFEQAPLTPPVYSRIPIARRNSSA